jgi:hypothetical protein
MANEPLKGNRMVDVAEFKTRRDWAMFIKEIADVYYRRAKKITLVMDNFKTHAVSTFYETFEPKEAKRLWIGLNIYTPKHSSWLNVTKIELHILNGQCAYAGQTDHLRPEQIDHLFCWRRFSVHVWSGGS